MTSFVLNFGGDREATFAALLMVVGEPARIFVLPKEQEDALVYREFDGSLIEALELSRRGATSSVQVTGTAPVDLVASVFRPAFAGGTLAVWSGYGEGTEVGESSFTRLHKVDGLSYIALSLEDSPDFESSQITDENFPWSDWRLIAGAVRDRTGQWLTRWKRRP